MVEFFGLETPVELLTPSDFAAYRAELAKRRNLVAVGNEVTRVRTIFIWCKVAEVLPPRPTFAPDFKRFSAKALRRHRRLAGKKLYTAGEIRLIHDECGIHLGAMVMLGINGGFGNADCATLPLDAVDLDGGLGSLRATKDGNGSLDSPLA